jgi:3-oxo-5-alpha-steroid 4-dehydrogenase 1
MSTYYYRVSITIILRCAEKKQRRQALIISWFYTCLIISWFVLALCVCTVLFFVSAPYGRHSRPGWGPSLKTRLGWLIMEAVSPVVFSLFFFVGNQSVSSVSIIFVSLWLFHYIHRAFVYPFLIQHGEKPMALSVVGMAVAFNLVNAYINGRYLNFFSGTYTILWLNDPRFILGILLFIGGFTINVRSDAVLRNLRKNATEEYGIPKGGMFELVSCANYFGEVVEWFGWAALTWSVAGLSFAVWTAANLLPRAYAHHRWYRETFAHYPERRKAILPFVL